MEQINIIENVIQAISILDKTDEYLDSLNDKLSECDKLETDFRHIIELKPVDEIDLKKLYLSMQENFNKRRKIKKDMEISRNLTVNIGKLTNSSNRGLLVQTLKNVESKYEKLYYNNRILDEQKMAELIVKKSTKRGRRPSQVKENVKEGV